MSGELRYCDRCIEYWDAIDEASGECCPNCGIAGDPVRV